LIALQTNQCFEERRVPILHVDGAAAIEPAILLRELEGVDGPVLRLCIHDVQMTEKQHRFSRAFSVVTHEHVTLGRVIERRDENHIAFRKGRVQQMFLDNACCFGRAPIMGCPDLHKFLEDVTRELLIDSRRERRRYRPKSTET